MTNAAQNQNESVINHIEYDSENECQNETKIDVNMKDEKVRFFIFYFFINLKL